MHTKYVYVINSFFPGNPGGMDFRTSLKTYNSLKEAYNGLLDYLNNIGYKVIDTTHLYKNCEEVGCITISFKEVEFKALIHFYEIYC